MGSWTGFLSLPTCKMGTTIPVLPVAMKKKWDIVSGMRSANTRYCWDSEVTVLLSLPFPDSGQGIGFAEWLVLPMSCFSGLIWGLLCEPVSILEDGATVGAPYSHKSPFQAECKAAAKDSTSKKSSLTGLSFALRVPWPFLLNPHTLPPDLFPLLAGWIPSFCPLFPPRTWKGVSGLQIHVNNESFTSIYLFIYFWLPAQHTGSLLCDRRSNLYPLQWKRGVLTTGPARKSLYYTILYKALKHL